jgi:hypothetical protein
VSGSESVQRRLECGGYVGFLHGQYPLDDQPGSRLTVWEDLLARKEWLHDHTMRIGG